MTLPKPARTGLQTVGAMLNAGWPAHLVTPSFLFTTPSDPLLGDVLLQTPAYSAGCLTAHVTRSLHPPPRPHSALPRRCARRIAIHFICSSPQLRDSRSVWRELAPHHNCQGPWTLARNLGCLRTLVPSRFSKPERLAQAGSRYELCAQC
jgi:hypothetical protein